MTTMMMAMATTATAATTIPAIIAVWPEPAVLAPADAVPVGVGLAAGTVGFGVDGADVVDGIVDGIVDGADVVDGIVDGAEVVDGIVDGAEVDGAEVDGADGNGAWLALGAGVGVAVAVAVAVADRVAEWTAVEVAVLEAVAEWTAVHVAVLDPVAEWAAVAVLEAVEEVELVYQSKSTLSEQVVPVETLYCFMTGAVQPAKGAKSL